MSFFGDEAEIDESQSRSFNYATDTAELDRTDRKSAGEASQARIPQTLPPLQPLADLWQTPQAQPLSVQDLEKHMQSLQANLAGMPPMPGMPGMPPMPPMPGMAGMPGAHPGMPPPAMYPGMPGVPPMPHMGQTMPGFPAPPPGYAPWPYMPFPQGAMPPMPGSHGESINGQPPVPQQHQQQHQLQQPPHQPPQLQHQHQHQHQHEHAHEHQHQRHQHQHEHEHQHEHQQKQVQPEAASQQTRHEPKSRENKRKTSPSAKVPSAPSKSPASKETEPKAPRSKSPVQESASNETAKKNITPADIASLNISTESDDKPLSPGYSLSSPQVADQKIRTDLLAQQAADSLNRRGGSAPSQGGYLSYRRSHGYSERRELTREQRYNGLMGDRDRNYIMRIQLEQLLSQDPYNEDFYFQVYTTLDKSNGESEQKASPRVEQQAKELARTYLFRRNRRGGSSRQSQDRDHLARMQQQVVDAVQRVKERQEKRAQRQTVEVPVESDDAAADKDTASDRKSETPEDKEKEKEKPAEKARALGSHGGKSGPVRPRLALALTATLDNSAVDNGATKLYTQGHIRRSIEAVYDALLELESHERGRPPPDSSDAADWAAKMPVLQTKLWDTLQVLAPVDSKGQHPFILMLNHRKGKKLIPRVFPYLDPKRRLTMLTRLFVQFGDLEVVSHPEDSENVELFSQTVLQPMVHLISEADFETIVGLVSLLAEKPNVAKIAATRIGQAFLTVLISRAELINQEGTASASSVEMWKETFATLFAKLRNVLASLFPNEEDADIAYVWHFLASLALASDLDGQRSLVDAVRNRIFATMASAKQSNDDSKITSLNLFLNVMGLNATADDITELK